MNISNGTLIWTFSSITFEAYGRATEYYGRLLTARVSGYQAFDFSYEQWVDLICLTFTPDRHFTPLTPEILKSLKPEDFRNCKKKLQESLNFSEMYEDIISMSEVLGKSIPQDMKESLEQKDSTPSA